MHACFCVKFESEKNKTDAWICSQMMHRNYFLHSQSSHGRVYIRVRATGLLLVWQILPILKHCLENVFDIDSATCLRRALLIMLKEKVTLLVLLLLFSVVDSKLEEDLKSFLDRTRYITNYYMISSLDTLSEYIKHVRFKF